MPRYKILVEYDGTDYYGWQRQPEGPTVEGEIEDALSTILREPIDIKGQGRTDSGVHAEAQVAHFDYPGELDSHRITYALLGVLPKDISVYSLEQVRDDFHARFDAKSRRYRFQIVTRPSPLLHRQAQMVLNELDLEAMLACAESILGIHDFESFTKSGPEQERTKCDIMFSEFEVRQHMIIYHIQANRFLRHLVRRLVGTMIQVGKGRKSVDEFLDILKNPTDKEGGHGAQAKGLILEKVGY
ncbi:tRNA pseudouridine(38-40) synthase TruA [Aliifodinibius sp. S!AR15-10]|uniref:tRNA pseudouridine(38-40) synthase TruA n=1 Tax=Aliifodinibius sp. S!AR15-10 TaxID=2950437 RepID=UPI002857DDDF|nr:tRNA pseudouridine(38-40) synthase TruA [Aliifodinibius sp. S!AR15-10]MDR8390818.1 tRNA pseudouridine(38-40) synthase TruA [Aliifodinibius sp. S!AR15-10]